MQELPRIYCLTIPGSERHKIAADKLNSLGLLYEFVYGKIHDAQDIPWESVHELSLHLHWRYPDRCYGCKCGHIELLKKAIADGNSCCISCEDDIDFDNCDWNAVLNYCNRIDQLGGILNLGSDAMGYDNWYSYWQSRDDEFIKSTQWATDTCYVLNKEGMQYYLNGLLLSAKESDTGMCDYNKQNNRIIPCLTREYSPIKMNSKFYLNSNIV